MFVNPFRVEGFYYSNPNSNFVFPEKKGCWQLLFPNWNTMIQKDLVVPATKTRFPRFFLLNQPTVWDTT